MRKALLRRYRQEVVRPALLGLEEAHLLLAAQSHMSVRPWTVAEIISHPPVDSFELLAYDEGPLTWCFYRIWALVRITGQWPFTCIGGTTLDATIPACPYCAVTHADVRHALVECPGTLSWRRQCAGAPLLHILGVASEVHIRFVGGCLRQVMLQCASLPTTDIVNSDSDSL